MTRTVGGSREGPAASEANACGGVVVEEPGVADVAPREGRTLPKRLSGRNSGRSERYARSIQSRTARPGAGPRTAAGASVASGPALRLQGPGGGAAPASGPSGPGIGAGGPPGAGASGSGSMGSGAPGSARAGGAGAGTQRAVGRSQCSSSAQYSSLAHSPQRRATMRQAGLPGSVQSSSLRHPTHSCSAVHAGRLGSSHSSRVLHSTHSPDALSQTGRLGPQSAALAHASWQRRGPTSQLPAPQSESARHSTQRWSLGSHTRPSQSLESTHSTQRRLAPSQLGRAAGQ